MKVFDSPIVQSAGTALLSVTLHLVLGWEWTILAGIVGGIWKGRGGWWLGGLGVGIGWGALVAWTFIVAPAPTMRMIEIIGGIIGGLPALVTPLISVLFGVLLGTAGGGLGLQIRLLIPIRYGRVH